VHYCNWNLADYAAHTGHLSVVEDAAYRRMLDFYYLHEKPLSRSPKTVARDVRMIEHEVEVRSVLSQFFVRSADGYRNKRADIEIARYREKVKKASNAGRASVERRLNGRSTDVQRPCNDGSTNQSQEPRTKNQPPIAPHSGGSGGGDRSAIDSDGREGRDRVVEVQQALGKTTVRDGMPAFDRARALMGIARRMQPTGLTGEDVDELWPIAQAQAASRENGDPGALLCHWLDENLWREVRDERREQQKQTELRSREAGASQ
jgi:uncharacterized protein YdaU (DUF1376 family)